MLMMGNRYENVPGSRMRWLSSSQSRGEANKLLEDKVQSNISDIGRKQALHCLQICTRWLDMFEVASATSRTAKSQSPAIYSSAVDVGAVDTPR